MQSPQFPYDDAGEVSKLVTGTDTPAFAFIYSRQWGEKWHAFQVNDIQLLQSSELCPTWFNQTGMFIASLNSKAQLRALLEHCGYAISHYRTTQFICRTSQPTVTEWLNRWGALASLHTGHRPRYLMDEWTSPSFFKLCLRAHELRQINKLRVCKLN